MASRGAPAIWAWLNWLLMFVSWVLLLAGVAGLQKVCGSSQVDSIASVADYLAPVSCSALFRYTWWTTWYQFAMMIVLPVFLAKGRVHTWRYGLIGLLSPIAYLLMTTANTYQYVWNAPGGLSGSASSRAKVLFSGALIGAVSDMTAIILLAVHSEKEPPPVAMT